MISVTHVAVRQRVLSLFIFPHTGQHRRLCLPVWFPILYPASYALRRANNGNYLPPLPPPPLAANAFINPARCPTSLTPPLSICARATDCEFCELQPTSCCPRITSCALCLRACVCTRVCGMLVVLFFRIEGRCLAWLFLS